MCDNKIKQCCYQPKIQRHARTPLRPPNPAVETTLFVHITLIVHFSHNAHTPKHTYSHYMNTYNSIPQTSDVNECAVYLSSLATHDSSACACVFRIHMGRKIHRPRTASSRDCENKKEDSQTNIKSCCDAGCRGARARVCHRK